MPMTLALTAVPASQSNAAVCCMLPLLVLPELVSLANAPAYLESLSTYNQLWARVVQSGAGHMISADQRLQNHAADMAIVLLTMHLSSAAVSMYIGYMSQWVQLRQWLRHKAHGCPPGQQQRTSPTCPVDVGGVLVTPQQLQDMTKSNAAMLLLDARGTLGGASMVCFHACVVNVLLLAALLLSCALALQVAPRLLPEPLLMMFYPLKPEVAGDMCWPEDEPQPITNGMFGRVLAILDT